MPHSYRYYNAPPSLPEYFYKHYPERSFAQLIEWANKEYNDALRQFAKRRAWHTVRMLAREYSPMRLLAEMPEFRKIISLLNDVNYNRLTHRERSFIRRSWEVYEHLRRAKLI